MQQLTCSPKDCVEILNANGFVIGLDKLYEGFKHDFKQPRENRIFPFGEGFPMPNGKWGYIVYKSDLIQFIKSHGGTYWEPASCAR